MCRVVECFDLEQREDAALDMLAQLHARARDDVKVRIYTAALYRLDCRLMDWQPITDAFTGARKSEQVRRNRLFATEDRLVRVLRQWSQKTKPDSLDHSEETRMAMNAGMLVQVISKHQHAAKARGYSIGARYVLSDYGRAYLRWLEARERDYRIARDALYREHTAERMDCRALMGGM